MNSYIAPTWPDQSITFVSSLLSTYTTSPVWVHTTSTQDQPGSTTHYHSSVTSTDVISGCLQSMSNNGTSVEPNSSALSDSEVIIYVVVPVTVMFIANVIAFVALILFIKKDLLRKRYISSSGSFIIIMLNH